MSVSDAQYAAWLAQDRPRRILCETDFLYAGATSPPVNVALAGTASAVSSAVNKPASAINDGSHNGVFNTGTWAQSDTYAGTANPWVEIDLAASYTVHEVRVYHLRDTGAGAFVVVWEQEANQGTRATDWGLTDYHLQWWDGAAWQTFCTVTGNLWAKNILKAGRDFTAPTTTKVRLVVDAGNGNKARLQELEIYTGQDPMTGTTYFADGLAYDANGLGAGPIVDGANVYKACLAEVPNYARSIDKATFTGATAQSFGQMRIANKDGLTNWLRDVILDGQQARFKLGDPSWAASDFRTFMVGTMQRVTQDANRDLIVAFSDGRLLADVAVSGAAIAATNQIAPIPLGRVRVKAYIEDAGARRYRFADAAYWATPLKDTGIAEVWDGGLSLNSVTASPSASAPTVSTYYDSASATTLPNVVVKALNGSIYTISLNYSATPISGAKVLAFVWYPSGSPGTIYSTEWTQERNDALTDGSFIVTYSAIADRPYLGAGHAITVGAGSTPYAVGGILALNGAATTAFDTASITTAAAGPTATSPTRTPTTPSDILLSVFASVANGVPSFTTATGMTQQASGWNSDGGSTFVGLSIQTQALSSTSATGTRTTTITNHNGANIGLAVLIKPAAAPSIDPATDTITLNSHGILAGDIVSIWGQNGDTIPGGLVDSNTANSGGTGYTGAGRYTQYVALTVTTNTFQLALYQLPTTVIDITSAGSGTFTFKARRFYDYGDGSVYLNVAATADVYVDVIADKLGPGSYYASDAFYWCHFAGAKQPATVYQGAHASYPTTTSDAETLDPLIGVFIGQSTSVMDLLNEIAKSANAFWGYTHDGKFTFGRIRTNPLDLVVDPNNFNTSVVDLTDNDVKDGGASDDRMMPLYRYVSAVVGRVYPPMSQARSDAPLQIVDALKTKGRTVRMPTVADAAYATTPWRYHSAMTDTGDIETALLDDATYYSPWMTFLRNRVLPHVDVRTFNAPLRVLFNGTKWLELGDKVSTNMPLKAGDSATLYWQIIGIDLRPSAGSVGLTLVRRRTPDSTTSSH